MKNLRQDAGGAQMIQDAQGLATEKPHLETTNKGQTMEAITETKETIKAVIANTALNVTVVSKKVTSSFHLFPDP
jgi:hypothetical protein